MFVITILLFLFFVSTDSLFEIYGIKAEKAEIAKLLSMPNYNFIPEIIQNRDEGHLDEAQKLAQYVINNPDLPDQEKAVILEKEINTEMNSKWNLIMGPIKGFFTGSTNSGLECSGAFTSDLVVYGDVRDLVNEGYKEITEKDGDPLVAALSGVGIATEVAPMIDWAPSVLKIFRKAGCLTLRFAGTLLDILKKSKAAGGIDDSLKLIFSHTADLVKNTDSLKRSGAIFRYVETADDLAAISKLAIKAPDEAYLLVKWGGEETFNTLKKMDLTEESLSLIKSAAKKGPDGARFLDSFRKGGKHHELAIKTRFYSRLGKEAYLGRLKQYGVYLGANSRNMLYLYWAVALVTLLLLVLNFMSLLNMWFCKRVTEQK